MLRQMMVYKAIEKKRAVLLEEKRETFLCTASRKATAEDYFRATLIEARLETLEELRQEIYTIYTKYPY